MAITEVKDQDNVTLGLGVLGMVELPAASPRDFVDVGYIKGLSVTYSRELREFESAGVLVKRIVFRDRLTLNATFAELSLDNLARVFQGTDNGPTHAFGGHRTITRYGIQFEHTRDLQAGGTETVTVEVFKAVPSGEFELAFAEEEFITYPVEFGAEQDTDEPSGQQYGRITIS